MASKAIVSGVYDTQVGSLPESTCMSLHTEATLGALADAGLKLSDIDGLLTAYSFASPQLMLGGVLAEYLGIRPKVNASICMGGMTGGLLVRHAESLVSSGMCRHVLCVTGDNRLTGMGETAPTSLFGNGLNDAIGIWYDLGTGGLYYNPTSNVAGDSTLFAIVNGATSALSNADITLFG